MARHVRVLGLDYGSQRVGVALGDTATKIASPWAIIESDDRLDVLRRIHELVERESIDCLVVGMPHALKDRKSMNKQAEEVRGFIADLKAQGMTVEEMDETLTSRLATSQMQERGEKGKRDDLAAAVILQSWLDVQ